MDIIEAIKQRHSVRKYAGKPVEINDVLEILNIARESPSSGNLQNWRFVIVTDEKKRKKIADACLQQAWMEEAPVHIVVCNDPTEVVANYEDAGRKYAIQNCAIVSQSIMLAALKFKLGSCFVGAFDDFAIREILNIPEHIEVEAIITLGYPAEEAREKKYGLEILTSINEFGKIDINKPKIKELIKKFSG